MIFVFLILVGIRTVWLTTGLELSIPELKWLLIGERLGDGFTMYKDLYDSTAPLAAFVYKVLDLVFGRSRFAHIVLSTMILIFQAGMFNSILLRNKAYSENSYLPAFFYVICASSVLDFMSLSPQLMSLTFVLAALNQVFRRIDNVVTDELFLSSGLFIGIAIGFYFPAIIFFPALLLSFLLFSTAILRRLLLFVYGTFVVLLLTFGYFIWRNAGQDFLTDFFYLGVIKPKIYYVSLFQYLEIGAVLLVTGLLSLSVIFTYRSTQFQLKMQQVMGLFLLAAILIAFITRELMSADLLFVVPSLSFFMVYFFLNLKKRFWKFLMPYLIVLGLLFYPKIWLTYNSENDLLVKPVTIHTQSSDRVMGIGLDVSEYQNCVFTGPFLDPFISERKLTDINFYDGAPQVYQAIEGSNADLVIDRMDIADKLFHRFPLLGKDYKKEAKDVYRKINN